MTTTRSCLAACLALSILALPPAAQANTFSPISPTQFQLKETGLGKGAYRKVRQLRAVYPRVGLTGLMGDLNRRTTPLMRGELPKRGIFTGYSWESGDNTVDYWYPQGLTGSGGVQAVSWYRSGDSDVRVGFVNPAKTAYRFALLVEPRGGTSFARVPIHAGGIAWAGRLMYVADTNHGFRVFDLKQILRVPDSRLGSSDNYRYLLPQVGRLRTVGGAFTFSAASVDRSSKRKFLVAGEYRTSGITRIARWRLGATNRLARGAATQAWATAFDQLQGVTTHKGRVFVSSSQGERGRLYFGRPGQPARNKGWGNTPQGLLVEGDRLWSHTEVPGHRTVFSKALGEL